jgi:ribonuclease HI
VVRARLPLAARLHHRVPAVAVDDGGATSDGRLAPKKKGAPAGLDFDHPSARAGGGVYVRWHRGPAALDARGVVVAAGGGAPDPLESRTPVRVSGRQTSQRAELAALREGLRFLARTRWRAAVVYSDSRNSVMQARGEWQASANHALVASMQRAVARARAANPGGDLRIEHVRGHKKDPRRELHAGNDAADEAATTAMALVAAERA